MGWTRRYDETLKGQITILMRWHTGKYSHRNVLRLYFTEFEFYLSDLLHRWQGSLDGDRLITRPIISVLSSTGMCQIHVDGSRRILVEDTNSLCLRKNLVVVLFFLKKRSHFPTNNSSFCFSKQRRYTGSKTITGVLRCLCWYLLVHCG